MKLTADYHTHTVYSDGKNTFEENFRRAMLLSDGDFLVFLSRPISAVLLAVVAALLLAMLSPTILRNRKAALSDSA